MFNSLAPGTFEWNFRYVIFKRILVSDGWGISCKIALIWMSLDFTGDQSTLVQVMAWCCQATSHYLSQCWPRSLSPYSVTIPQWVNSLWHKDIRVSSYKKCSHIIQLCAADPLYKSKPIDWYLFPGIGSLTHCCLVTSKDDVVLGQYWFR